MKDKIDLSYLVIGKSSSIERCIAALGRNAFIQSLDLEETQKSVPRKKNGLYKLYRSAGWLIIPFCLGCMTLLGVPFFVIGVLLGLSLGYFFSASYLGNEPLAHFLRPLVFRESSHNELDLVPARILRFYGCQNPLVSAAHKIFNLTQGKVVVISGDSLPQKSWGLLQTTLLDNLQGVPSITILISNVKTKEIEESAFENGFDFVIQPDEISTIPSLSRKQFYLFGRNRVHIKTLVPGVILGILGSLLLGLSSGVGKKIGELLWGIVAGATP